MAIDKAEIQPVAPKLTLPEFSALSETMQRYEMYSVLHALAERVHKMENEAADIMSPDAMMKLAEGFIGMS